MSENISGDHNKVGGNGLDFASLLQQAVAAEMSREDNVEQSINEHNSNRLGELENSVNKISQVLEHPERLPAFKQTKDHLEGRFTALENQMNSMEQNGISAMEDMAAKIVSMRQDMVSEFQTRMTAIQNQIATELAGFMVTVNRSLGEVVHVQAVHGQQQPSGSNKISETSMTSINSSGQAVEEVSVTPQARHLTGLHNSETGTPYSKGNPVKSLRMFSYKLDSCDEDVQKPHDDNAQHQERQSSSVPHNSGKPATGTKRLLDEESSTETSNSRKRRLTSSPIVELGPLNAVPIAPQQAHQDPPDSIRVAMQERPIAMKVFEYLSQKDLLNCSLVCTGWNVHAREVLRLKKGCLMYIDFDRNSYTDLENLSKTLWESDCLPYWGISVSCGRNYGHQRRLTLKARKQKIWKMFEEAVAAKLANIRCIEVCYNAGQDNNATVGIESVCQRVADSLEILKLSGKPPAVSKLKDGKNPFCNLGKLKDFRMPKLSLERELNCLSVLARVAPNLERINGCACPGWIEDPVFSDLLTRGVIKQFKTLFGPHTMVRCRQFANMNLKLDKLVLWHLGSKVGCPPLKQWNRLSPSVSIASHLLKTSSETLTTLMISLQELKALYDMNDTTVCSKLEWLRLNFRLENSNDLLRGLNLAQKFPKVEFVSMDYGRWAARNKFEDLGQHTGILEFVNKLTLTLRSSNNSVDKKEVRAVVISLARLCPNVKHFYAYDHSATHARILMETLWSVWPDLETINIAGIPISHLRHSFDATICGITEARAKILRESLPEIYSVDFAPVLPSILDKTKLRKLRLEIIHDVSSSKNIGERMLTRLSGVLAFQRMPQLTIELYRFGVKKRDYLFDFTHLESMVKIECYNLVLVA